MVGLRIDRGGLEGTASDCERHISDLLYMYKHVHTARLFPVPCFNASRPPGPKLLLLEFLRRGASELPMSRVAFSLSAVFRESVAAPRDFRARRVAGTVISPDEDILSAFDFNSCEKST